MTTRRPLVVASGSVKEIPAGDTVDFSTLGLGTAATHDVPASGDASAAQAVLGSDSRLANNRDPNAHGNSHGGGSDPIVYTINTQTTSYTLVLGDSGKVVLMNVGSANNLTVPPNSSVAFPVGTLINGAQVGAGQTTIVAGSGVTVNATPGLKIAAQYGSFALLKTATDTWIALGRLSA